MKALILGSTGFFGRATAAHLASEAVFDQILLGSRSQEKATELAKELGQIASPQQIDIADAEALCRAVSKVDVVINVAGPAPETSLPAMLASMREGKHYCDISGESSVLEQAEEHESQFKAAGISILIGVGFHPGILDLLGETAISVLDDVDSVELYIVGTLADYGDPDTMIAAVNAGWEGSEGFKAIYAATGLPALKVLNGKRVAAEPASVKTTSTTPDGFEVEFMPFGTFEPLALHRRHPSIPELSVNFGLWPKSANRILRRDAPAVMKGETGTGESICSLFEQLKADNTECPKVHFWSKARGSRQGRKCVAMVHSNQDWASNRNMIATTTGALAYAATALATGHISKRGLLTSTEAFNPKDVFDVVAPSDEAKLEINIFQ